MVNGEKHCIGRRGSVLSAVCAAILIYANVAHPQPDTLWTRAYGGADDDIAFSVAESGPDGYIVAGSTESYGAGGSDVYIVKIDLQGDTLWARAYGGSNSDQAYSIAQSGDGGYVVAGYTQSFGAGSRDFYLLKVDGQGDTLWTRTYGMNSSDIARSVTQTADGGYVVVGYSSGGGSYSSDVYVVKTNSTGDTLWTRLYDFAEIDEAYSVQSISDGGYVLAGRSGTYSAVSIDFLLIKMDEQGDTLWTRTYNRSDYDEAYSVQETFDGGYVLAGFSDAWAQSYSRFLVVRTDDQGNSIWSRTYGRDRDNGAMAICQTLNDSDFVVAGWSDSPSSGLDAYVVKINGQGDTLWTLVYSGIGTESIRSILPTVDGGFVFAGGTSSIATSPDDFYVIRTGVDSTVSCAQRSPYFPATLRLAFRPNPFNSTANITIDLSHEVKARLAVYDILGRVISTLQDGRMSVGTHQFEFDGGELPSGLYIVRLEAPSFTATQKAVLLK